MPTYFEPLFAYFEPFVCIFETVVCIFETVCLREPFWGQFPRHSPTSEDATQNNRQHPNDAVSAYH
jgi:hypothetical protein